MNPKNRVLATTLKAESGSPAFFIQRFQGRQEAVSHGPHCHRFFELVVIEDGKGSQTLENNWVTANKGDVFVLAPGETHNPDGLDSTTHWIIAFDGSFISRKCEANHLPYSGLPGEVVLLGFARPAGAAPVVFQLSDAALQFWLSLFQRARQELAEKKLGYIESTQALLSLILIELARLAAPQMSYSPGEHRAILASFFAVLEEHFRSRTNLKLLSKSLNLSAAYLTDLIRRETGRTAMEWLRVRRLSEAKFLLRETHKSIKEIATEVGYQDSSLLIRHFRQELGQSPKAWRDAQS